MILSPRARLERSFEENFTSLDWPKNLLMICQQKNRLGFTNTCCFQFPKSILDHLHARESRVLCVSYFLRSLKWPGTETWQIDCEVKTKRSRRKTNTKQYKVWQCGRKCRNMIFVRKCSREYSHSVSVSLCNAGSGRKFTRSYVLLRPPLWSSGQSFWLQIQRSRVRFPWLPGFLSSSGSGRGSTQPREVNWGATWIKSSGSGPENRD